MTHQSADSHSASVSKGAQEEMGELVEYLARSSRLSPQEAARLVNEVLAFMSEAPEEFVRRRHLALQAQGLSNRAIYLQISEELAGRRFRAPEYSERQIRRIIYG
ncbi:hypothetical protein JM946_27295 [Steroidobacter sp. S1-65]|uniref:Uncharacterized protein n=1 Tax=Steroidobacter gossypii TaxID=2805490 RepID=A0ABS1X5G1_9GAMM|nr:hypothetical protein [Steroidobacter gossypii]MBM0108454.1 hypothetical protein [Steroidobacter gossypii]